MLRTGAWEIMEGSEVVAGVEGSWSRVQEPVWALLRASQESMQAVVARTEQRR